MNVRFFGCKTDHEGVRCVLEVQFKKAWSDGAGGSRDGGDERHGDNSCASRMVMSVTVVEFFSSGSDGVLLLQSGMMLQVCYL